MKKLPFVMFFSFVIAVVAGHADKLKFFWYQTTIDTNLGILGSSAAFFNVQDSLKVFYRGHQHDMKYAELNATHFTWQIQVADTNYTGGPAQIAGVIASNGQPHAIYQSADYQHVYHTTFFGGSWHHNLQDNLHIENLDW